MSRVTHSLSQLTLGPAHNVSTSAHACFMTRQNSRNGENIGHASKIVNLGAILSPRDFRTQKPRDPLSAASRHLPKLLQMGPRARRNALLPRSSCTRPQPAANQPPNTLPSDPDRLINASAGASQAPPATRHLAVSGNTSPAPDHPTSHRPTGPHYLSIGASS